MLDLQKFCGDDPFRPYLQKPVTVGRFTYATNGHIMVRVSKCDDVATIKEKINFERPLAGFDKAIFGPVMLVKELPTLPATAESDCDACEGRGHEHDCPDCSCVCDL